MPKDKKVLYQLDDYYEYDKDKQTDHLGERYQRLVLYGAGEYLDAFVVDTGHRDGLEVHIVDSIGVIHIFNKESKRYVTILSGRPAQIKMYYEQLGLEIDDAVEDAIKTAHERNEREGANEI